MKVKAVARAVLKHGLRVFLYGIPLSFILLIVAYIGILENRPDLDVWHQVVLDAEYTEDSDAKTLYDYLEIEGAVFVQLERYIYGKIDPEEQHLINRYHAGSLSDPALWRPNWNRTFELQSEEPKAGVLLLHGMSDSPYSLRGLGERMNEAGAWVVGLRLPGHGTIPSGLVHVRWQDMAAAVRLGVRHLREQVGDAPIHLVGYSNGGALAVHYALSTIEDAELPSVDSVILLSPEIGITSIAQFAVWQARLGSWLGLDKLAWNSILPEYDPFKYGSFAVNAGDQAYRLTMELKEQLAELGEAGLLERMPPVLAFQSAIDATVSADALVTGLFDLLPEGGHELVLFDVHRTPEVAPLLTSDPHEGLESLMNDHPLSATISLLTTVDGVVVERRKCVGENAVVETPTGMSWPKGVYSLSHIALPFSPDDPLYGWKETKDETRIQLGTVQLRGERGALRIPAGDMLRLRCNPFYEYLERRSLEFTALGE